MIAPAGAGICPQGPYNDPVPHAPVSFLPARAGGALLVSALAALSLAACGSSTPEPQQLVRVTNDEELAEAGSLVADGGLILIEEGTYHGTLQVSADDVTVRGADRNGVILDGQLEASSGIVGTGERFTVENLTVRGYLQNGVLVTGVTDENGAGIARGPDGYLPDAAPDPVPGYLVQYVTAENNGLYGIYAFNRTDGVIRNNLANGGSDSGIYVGQCVSCNALVENNVMQWSAVGLELANASDVTIVGNRIVENRIGITVLSNYLEAHGPTKNTIIAGNVISNNNTAETPEHANGAFGTGIGLAGTVGARVSANRIEGNDNVGISITSSEDFAPVDNAVENNAWGGNGLDVSFTASPSAPGEGTCVLDEGIRTDPEGMGCDPGPGSYVQPAAPEGVSFASVPHPAERPGLESVDETPRALPETIERPDPASIEISPAELLEAAS
ncbi:hypothetical protein GCM10010910_26260 [Microbacterium nanhaiense]|uniref:Right handed beta helix domain-containing protein n=1 Tax=Microbacterium nanhaiense TaxID=1301026 RepID=A0ABQ2N4P5_9MICO|nr:hypothetical protein GCM10010910_26260 [Microbacterium nanhaiense]